MGMSETDGSGSRSLATHQANWQLGPRSHVKKAQLLSRIYFFATEGFSVGLPSTGRLESCRMGDPRE